MNPPDWLYAKLQVQKFYPFPVGQLTASEFLAVYWRLQWVDYDETHGRQNPDYNRYLIEERRRIDGRVP